MITMDGIRPVYVYFGFIIIQYTHVCCIKQWDMQTYCGQTIAQDEYAGELTFNSARLRGDNESICDITIAPKQTTDSGGLVLFYFTDFKLGFYCYDTNVTIQEVNSSLPRPSDARTVLCIRDAICGDNATLINLVLTTRYSHLGVTFKQSDYGRSHITASFQLKFATFHEGSCGDSDFQCSNDRCIDESINCRDDIKPCGDNSQCMKKEKSFQEKYKLWWDKNLVWFGLGIGLFWALIILHSVYKWCKRRHYDCSLGSAINFLRDRCRDGSRDGTPTPAARGHSLSISMSYFEPTERPTQTDASPYDSVTSDRVSGSSPIGTDSQTSADDDFSRRWSALAPNIATSASLPDVELFAPSENDNGTPAPPSYEEFVANEDIYKTTNA